jgi:hypothetical protein
MTILQALVAILWGGLLVWAGYVFGYRHGGSAALAKARALMDRGDALLEAANQNGRLAIAGWSEALLREMDLRGAIRGLLEELYARGLVSRPPAPKPEIRH